MILLPRERQEADEMAGLVARAVLRMLDGVHLGHHRERVQRHIEHHHEGGESPRPLARPLVDEKLADQSDASGGRQQRGRAQIPADLWRWRRYSCGIFVWRKIKNDCW